MLRIFDTHAHFEDADDVEAILERAKAAGVERVLAVGGSDELNRNALRTHCPAALGLDRDQTSSPTPTLCLQPQPPNLVAIGEIGLDCHYDPHTLKAQCELFAAQLALADEMGLPVVVHTREADDATLGVIDEIGWHHGDRLRGVIHSYTGAPRFAGQLLDRGFMVSFSGIATFKSAEEVRASARYVPNDRILVETDSPYLAPVPLRGRRCEPAMVVHTVRRLAEERGVAPEFFAELTFANGCSLFGI